MSQFLRWSFLLNCTLAFSLNPSRKYLLTPESFNLPYNQFYTITPDNAHINTWVIAADSAQKHITVIVAEQEGGNMSSQLMLAEALHNRGVDVVLFDYRGFGESSDFAIDSSYLYYSEFVTDLVSVIQKSKKLFPQNKTCIFARSMGSIITSIAFKEEQVDYIVGDGYIKSLDAAKRRFYNFTGIQLKVPSDSMRFANTLSGINARMLLFAGAQDWYTTVDDARQIIDKYRYRKMVVYPFGHLETIRSMTHTNYADGMIEEMMGFFEAYKE